MPTALADMRDVGRYVARVIADPRTLNKRVHVYSEVYTQNKVLDVVEGVSGERLGRGYVSFFLFLFLFQLSGLMLLAGIRGRSYC